MSVADTVFTTLGMFAILTTIAMAPAGQRLATLGWLVQMLALAALLSLFFWLMGWV